MRTVLAWAVVSAVVSLVAACGDDVTLPPEAPLIEGLAPATGPTEGGAIITVTGKNFGAEAALTFDDAPAEISSAEEGELLARLPEGEGSAEVRVESRGLRSSPSTFTYAPPFIEGIEPATALASGGAVITIVGKNFGLAPEVRVGEELAEMESWTHWEAVVRTPAGPPGPADVRLTAGGQSSNATSLTYECPEGQVAREGECGHDFSLTVQIGDQVIRANGPLDRDPSPDRIVLEDFRPEAFGGELRVDGLLIEVEREGADEVVMASTSSSAVEGSKHPQFAMGGGGGVPFEEVPVTVTIDLDGYFEGNPTTFQTTVHLQGDHLPLDDAGSPLEEGTISYAHSRFRGELDAGSGEAVETRDLGTVASDVLRDAAGPVAFAPEDLEAELSAEAPSALRGHLHMELGPRVGVHHPVSARLRLRVLRE